MKSNALYKTIFIVLILCINLDKFFKIISENGSINIVKKNTNTAYYIPDTNTIVLPVFITEDKDLYIMFGSHEVSHAMHTPKDFYDIHNDSDRKVFKLKNGKKYRTVNDATFDFGEDGRVKNLVEEVSFNGKPGELVHIRMKTFKVVSETAMDKLREAQSAELDNGILKCFRAIKNKDTAFCTPIVMD